MWPGCLVFIISKESAFSSNMWASSFFASLPVNKSLLASFKNVSMSSLKFESSVEARSNLLR